MARMAGRNRVMSWIAGVFCVGVIAVLLWFAAPLGMEFVNFIGDLLRGTTI